MSAETAPRPRAAVLGHPVGHSLSPVLHRAAYEALGLAWDYGLVDVTEHDLPDFVRGLDQSWRGLSLTMPLKEAIRPLLADVDPVADATGSVNTVVLAGDGRHGYNTDVAGIVVSLDEQDAGRGPATVLGNGATARSAVAALAERGARSVEVVARRQSGEIVAVGERLGIEVRTAGWDQASRALTADVVVSTVPKGVADVLASQVPGAPGCLLDVVYDPWPTPLAAAWAAAGGRVGSGLDMLLHQAVRQVELMTGQHPSVEVMRAALQAAHAARSTPR